MQEQPGLKLRERRLFSLALFLVCEGALVALRGAHLPIHLNVVQSLVMSCFPSFLSCGRGRATLICVLGPPLLPNRFSAKLTAA